MRSTLCSFAIALVLFGLACSDDSGQTADTGKTADAGPYDVTASPDGPKRDKGKTPDTFSIPDGPFTPDWPLAPDGPVPVDGPTIYDIPYNPDGPYPVDGPVPVDGPFIYDAPYTPDGPSVDGPVPLDGPYIYDVPYVPDGPYPADAPSTYDVTILPDIPPMPDGIILPDGQTGDAGVMQQCQWMNVLYMAELKKAKVCSPMLPVVHCTHLVKDRLICPCSTYVEAVSNDMIKLETEFLNQDCASFFMCPAIVCPQPSGADCVPSGSGVTVPGSCVDKYSP